MSFHSLCVDTDGRKFRRSVQQDLDDIKGLLSRSTKEMYGDRNIGSLIELSVLSISLVDAKDKVLGFVSLQDHPNVPGVDPAHWEFWIRNMYRKFYLARNSLFVHMMCYDPSLSDTFVKDVMRSLFTNDYYLHQIVFVMPPSIPEELMLQTNFITVYPVHKVETTDSQYLYVACRKYFCPRVRVRRAVEEDNDDLVEILDQKCQHLKELYGDFYIREILAHHPNRKILAVEDKEVPVGVMCLSSNINYEQLNKVYELQPYCGLMKPTPMEKEKMKRKNKLIDDFGDVVTLGKFDPFDSMKQEEVNQPERDTVYHKNESANPKHKRHKSKSVVSFGKKIHLSRSLENIINYRNLEDCSREDSCAISPSVSQHTNVSMDFSMLADDESMEYDIVNIDKSLLDVASYETNNLIYGSKSGDFNANTKRKYSSNYRRKSKSSLSSISSIDNPKCIGTPNAFVIELFAMHEYYDDRCAFEILEVAFELFPKLDYCIIQLPTSHPNLQLLDHFTLASTREKICSGQSLYITHKNSILSELRVRKAEFCDIPQISSLLSNMDGRESLWMVEDSIVNENDHQAFVFLSGQAIIGLGILEPTEQTVFLRSKYDIDVYRSLRHHHHGNGINAGISNIKTVMVSPAFEPHCRFFAREMMRLSGSQSLLWMSAFRNKWVMNKANLIVTSMIPVLPRKQVQLFHAHELNKINPFSLWYLNPRWTSLPKIMVDRNIVVVGASTTALSFLNTLLFENTTTYLTFSNLTLVSPNGLPYIRHSKKAVEMMFPITNTYNDRVLKSTPYTYYVNLVQSTMCAISRQDKYIELTNGRKVYYDILVLMYGNQYQHPDYFKKHWEKEQLLKSRKPTSYMRRDNPAWDEFYLHTDLDVPDNVFIINDVHDANRALNTLRDIIFVNGIYKVIVYGCTLEAYCCISALLDSGISPDNLVFVEPFPSKDSHEHECDVIFFCNEHVDKEAYNKLRALGIKMYRSYYFVSWNFHHVHNTIQSVTFLSYFHQITLQCSALFYYGKKGIDMNAFIAINECGLIYDTGLVIDSVFRTNDPHIYAAGANTKYRRSHHADMAQHKHYNSVEIGNKLGNLIRNQLDPFYEQREEENSERGSSHSVSNVPYNKRSNMPPLKNVIPKLPALTKPIIKYCELPGNLKYLEVSSPGLKLPHKYPHSLGYTGIAMETFKDGYFKLLINRDMMVESVTCLTDAHYNIMNFSALYGHSISMLNNIHIRFETGKVDNLFEFFSSPWACMIYHDHFADFMELVRSIVPPGSKTGLTINQELKKEHTNAPSPKESTRSALISRFDLSPFSEAIIGHLLSWLEDNEDLLPVYMQSAHVAMFQEDVRRNEFFRSDK